MRNYFLKKKKKCDQLTFNYNLCKHIILNRAVQMNYLGLIFDSKLLFDVICKRNLKKIIFLFSTWLNETVIIFNDSITCILLLYILTPWVYLYFTKKKKHNMSYFVCGKVYSHCNRNKEIQNEGFCFILFKCNSFKIPLSGYEYFLRI